MSLKLMIITNNSEIAKEAENSGVDRIFIDMEINGKKERQGHLDTVISRHSFEDISKIKSIINKSEILVRINPFYSNTKEEVEKVISLGADVIMLPMAKYYEEVKEFVDIVDNRVKTCLLLETSEALVRLDEILSIEGLDEVHVGLNDMHLSLGLDFMFELVSYGVVEYICQKVKASNKKFGFGGIAKVGQGLLPAENIIIEHTRLGSEMVILSRTFHEKSKTLEDVNKKFNFKEEINKIRKIEEIGTHLSKEDLDKNFKELKKKVEIISSKIRTSK